MLSSCALAAANQWGCLAAGPLAGVVNALQCGRVPSWATGSGPPLVLQCDPELYSYLQGLHEPALDVPYFALRCGPPGCC